MGGFIIKTQISLFAVFLLTSGTAWTQDEPIVTRVEGEAYLLHSPSKVLRGDPPRIYFENHYYNMKKIELGDKIPPLAILKTESTGKIKLIFENGDLIHVATGSLFRLGRVKVDRKEQTLLTLIAGKFRALIERDGPRSPTQVQTRNVAMGVRGTDFFVNSRNSEGKVELNVIRGEVTVQPLEFESASIPVATGQKAMINNFKDGESLDEAVILKKMEQSDLIAINDFVGIQNKYKYGESMMALTAAPKSKLELQLEELEKKAAENMKNDIKKYDPSKLDDKVKAKTTDKIDYVK